MTMMHTFFFFFSWILLYFVKCFFYVITLCSIYSVHYARILNTFTYRHICWNRVETMSISLSSLFYSCGITILPLIHIFDRLCAHEWQENEGEERTEASIHNISHTNVNIYPFVWVGFFEREVDKKKRLIKKNSFWIIFSSSKQTE